MFLALTEWSCLIELAIQTVFFVLNSTTALLLNELNQHLQAMNENDTLEISLKLDQWKRHYDLVRCSAEHINAVFGLILLLNITHISVDLTIYAYHFMYAFKVAAFDLEQMQYAMYCFQIILRFLMVTMSCWNIKTQVGKKFQFNTAAPDPFI